MTSSATSSATYTLPPSVTVSQPAHLPGDASLATEIMAGPPSLDQVRSAAQKRDPRKPSIVFSYLPESDPGTSYSGVMHGTIVGQEFFLPAADANRTVTGRAQRASARHHNEPPAVALPTAMSDGPVPIADDAMVVDSDIVLVDRPPTLSRSNSSPATSEYALPAPAVKPKRRDKGKGKAQDAGVRIKEEPSVIALSTPEPLLPKVNQDYCSACRSTGTLVYCDSHDCARAYHLLCLDPPLEHIDEGDSKWYCPECIINGKTKSASPVPDRRPPPGPFSNLYSTLSRTLPSEYQLPADIRTFFKDVATGERGTYVDTSDIRPPRLNRLGLQEERDPHRLKDKNGDPVLCFRCGKSALPEGPVPSSPTSSKRPRRTGAQITTYAPFKEILSCDYCPLHWHLDCLHPPLYTMPSFSHKWMCPNHAENVVKPKRRIPKQNTASIEVARTGQYNNGNIDVTPSEFIHKQPTPPMAVDEVHINGRRYRVPERIILLDFWDKISGNSADYADDSRSSSPLTSLSSLEDTAHDADDLELAQMLCNFQMKTLKPSPPPTLKSTAPPRSRSSLPFSRSGTSTRVDPAPESTMAAPDAKLAPLKISISLPASARAKAAEEAAAVTAAHTAPAKKKSAPRTAAASTRTRGSTRRADSASTAEITPDAAVKAPVKASRPSRATKNLVPKNEVIEAVVPATSSMSVLDQPDTASTSASTSTTATRASRKKTATSEVDHVMAPPTTEPETVTEPGERSKKRTRKRKADEEQQPSESAPAAEDQPAEKRPRKRKGYDDEHAYKISGKAPKMAKSTRETRDKDSAKTSDLTDATTTTTTTPDATASTSTNMAPPSTPTPSLKIRLPRMNLTGSPLTPQRGS